MFISRFTDIIIIIVVVVVVRFYGLSPLPCSDSGTMSHFRHFVVLLRWGMSPSQDLHLHKIAQHRKKRTYRTSMLRAVFEPTFPVFERSEIKRVLDGASTGIGFLSSLPQKLL